MTTGPQRQGGDEEESGSRVPRYDPNQLQMFYSATDLKNTITESGDRGTIGSHASHYGITTSERQSSSFDPGEEESLDEMWSRKLAESKRPEGEVHGGGVHESISSRGWLHGRRSDVTLHWNEDPEDAYALPDVRVWDAHHRIAAAADIEQQTGKTIWLNTEHQDPEQNMRFRAQREAQNPNRNQRLKDPSLTLPPWNPPRPMSSETRRLLEPMGVDWNKEPM